MGGGQTEPTTANGNEEAKVRGGARAWRHSPEYSATRKIATLLAICAIASVTLILWPAASARYATSMAYSRAQGVAVDALMKFDDAQKVEEQARLQLNQTRLKIAAETSSGSPTQLGEQLQKRITFDENDVRIATERRQAADTRREDTWRKEIDAERLVEEAYNELLLKGGFSVALIVAIMLLFRYVRDEKRRTFENRQLLQEIGSQSGQIDDAASLRALWHDNRDQLQLYHRLILNYASSTRQTTLATLVAGFAFLITAGGFAIFASSAASAVAISVVSAAGAAVAGFIAQAVLKNSETSSREVMTFFSHPLEVERILAAERVIEAMPKASQDAARLLIVQALTRSADGISTVKLQAISEPGAEESSGNDDPSAPRSTIQF